MDPLDKTQEVYKVDLEGIQTPDEIDREIGQIWRVCFIGSGFVPLIAAIFVVAVWAGAMKMATACSIAPVVMAIVLMTFGLAFVIPAGVTSIKRMSMTVRMAYRGLHTNQHVANDLRSFVREAKPIIESFRNKTDDGLIERIEGHLKRIADRVQKDTQPLIPKKREPTEA